MRVGRSHTCNKTDNNRRCSASCRSRMFDVHRAHDASPYARGDERGRGKEKSEAEREAIARHTANRRENSAWLAEKRLGRKKREREWKERDTFSQPVGKERPVRADRRCKEARASPVSAHGSRLLPLACRCNLAARTRGATREGDQWRRE